MAIVLAQPVVGNLVAAGAGSSKAFGSNNTAGNTIIVLGLTDGGATTPTVSDTAGNTYSARIITTVDSAGVRLFAFHCIGCLAGPNTVSIANCGTFNYLVLYEYSGVGSFDTSTFAVLTGQTNFTVPITLAHGNELVVGGLQYDGGGQTSTPASGYAISFAQGSSAQSFSGIISSAGSSTAGATIAAGQNGIVFALAFAPTGGSGGGGGKAVTFLTQIPTLMNSLGVL